MLGEEIDEITGILGGVTLESDQSNENTTLEKKSNDNDGDDTQSNEIDTKCEEVHIKEDNLRVLLQSLQCPFNWNLESIDILQNDVSKTVLSRTIAKLEEIEEVAVFQWRHFILKLVLCHEYYHKNEIDSAFNELRKCEEIINNPISKGYYETFFHSTKIALMHVVLASKCYLYLKKGDLDEVDRILGNICKEDEMDNSCKAALLGVKASVSMEYGHEGNKVARLCINEALEIDSEQSEWHFLLGKCLGRIRRVENYGSIPIREEIEALETAINIAGDNPAYIIFLAELYRETTLSLRSQVEFKQQIDKMNKSSLELYKKALEIQGNCSHVIVRCARGFYKLPSPYKDIKKAKECSDRALQMAPTNAMMHHTKAFICEREYDYKNAKKHYQKSGELGAYVAFLDLHRLEYRLDNTYDPIPRFEYMLQRYTEELRKEQTLIHMGSYYFFIKEDHLTAFKKYWHQVIKENPHSERLKTHRCLFVYMDKPENIYELIYDEARLALRSTNSKSTEEVKLLREILSICLKLFPELDRSSPVPRRKMILNEANSNKSQFRGRNGRGRGNGSERSNRRLF